MVTKLYLGGLATNTSTSDIEAKFEAFGKVVAIDLRRNAVGESKGFCYITFEPNSDKSLAQSFTLAHLSHKSIEWCSLERENLENRRFFCL